MANYYELLKDPRWQRKRLEVMERDDFTCRWCGNTEQTLNVHHTRYRKGAAPWEYDSSELLCVCEPCHQKVREKHDRLMASTGYMGPYNLDRVMAYVSALLSLSGEGPSYCLYALKDLNQHAASVGVGNAIGVPASTIDYAIDHGIVDHTLLYELRAAVENEKSATSGNA